MSANVPVFLGSLSSSPYVSFYTAGNDRNTQNVVD